MPRESFILQIGQWYRLRVLGREGVGRYVLRESLKVKITAEAEDKYKNTISCVVNPIGAHSLSQTCI